MAFLAVSRGTSDWLLTKPTLLDAINDFIVCDRSGHLERLNVVEFIEGPFRMSATEDGRVIALWNVDYLTGTGDEQWGFIRLDGEIGLRAERSITKEVLERCLYIVNQRLKGLLIDAAYIHRSRGDGCHTCLAARGTAARQLNVCYYEASLSEDLNARRAILCVGPAFEFGDLITQAKRDSKDLLSLLRAAELLTSPSRKKPVGDASLFAAMRTILSPFIRTEALPEFSDVQIDTDGFIPPKHAFRALGMSYAEWQKEDSPLSESQRRILNSDAIEMHPLRIVGPGGSGKTLLMQLLALRRLEVARERGKPLRILYVVHNSAMADVVSARFDVLEGTSGGYRSGDRMIDVLTLAEYGRKELELDYSAIINPDAQAAKAFQLEQVAVSLRTALDQNSELVAKSEMFSQTAVNQDLFNIVVKLVMVEISTAIKGHGLTQDKKRYVQSERSLSRLHGVLEPHEREIVYAAYEHYHKVVFEGYEVLDTDDVAISLAGRLRTPIWSLKRRSLGYDFVFVDETQLFNENERRVLPLLTKYQAHHVPIILALDEAQEVFGQVTAGMGTLGIRDIANESLPSLNQSNYQTRFFCYSAEYRPFRT